MRPIFTIDPQQSTSVSTAEIVTTTTPATTEETTTVEQQQQATFALEYDMSDHTAISQQTNVIPMIVTSDTNDPNFVTMELAYQTS